MEVIIIDNIKQRGRKSKHSNYYSINDILSVLNRESIKKIYLVYPHDNKADIQSIKREPKFETIVLDDHDKSLNDLGLISKINTIIEKYGIRDDLMIITQNINTNINFNPILDYFEATRKPVMLLKKVNKSAISRHTVVSINKDNIITNITEHAVKPQSSLTSAGVYFIPHDAIFWIKKISNSGADKTSMDLFMKRLMQKRKVRGIVI